MKNPFVTIFDRAIDRMVKKTQSKRPEIRELQQNAHREGGKVQRYIVFDDIKSPQRKMIASYVVKVKDGTLQKLPDGTKPDVVIYLDVPTFWGILKNKTTIYPGGRPQVISPFGIWDGVRLGRIVYDGDQTAMRDLYLFDRRVLPLLEEELRAIGRSE